jgi:DNA-binding MarR family transcriptional regulator
MTRLIGDLESRGLVARSADPDDGRSQLIRLTEVGSAAVTGARAARAVGVGAILAEIAPEDLDVLGRATTVLEAALLRTTPAPHRIP